ncbi:hypothetical protein MUK42_26251 [Musa troglodytarum]|uniref:Uncharacterized protein n=1 Tax=Musa troglodytarum TaxID=320322 RepID=A0A9E7L3U3_9LILI|nr:hypothetical protein MUK42_26251 [Musa troglodytarum]
MFVSVIRSCAKLCKSKAEKGRVLFKDAMLRTNTDLWLDLSCTLRHSRISLEISVLSRNAAAPIQSNEVCNAIVFWCCFSGY